MSLKHEKSTFITDGRAILCVGSGQALTMVGRQDQPPKQRAIRTVQPLNVCDGGAVLKDIGTKGRSVELHPLAVLFNPANDLNQPQLLFLRVDDARGELLFSRQPGVSRSKCLAAYPLKSLVFVQGLSKHTFALGRHGGPPINLEAHDAFACKQWMQLLAPLIHSSPLNEVDLHAFPARATAASPSPIAPVAISSGTTLNSLGSPRSPTSPGGAPSPPSPRGRRPPAVEDYLKPEAGVRRGWHVNTGQTGLATLKKLPKLPGVAAAGL